LIVGTALAAAVFLLQGGDGSPHHRIDRAELRAGLDTLYAGDFATAVKYFEDLGSRDSADPAPLIFHAGAYIWWAAAKDSDDFEPARIDSLLDLAIATARGQPAGVERDFWLGTALGYRARERDLLGHAWGASRDAKAMRDAYRRVIAVDSSCVDCYLGLGLYSYALARAGTFARLVARLIGLGSGNVREGLSMLHRVAAGGDLARVEGGWVLASALVREAERDKERRRALRAEARAIVAGLAERYPANPVFQRFLTSH
jgi:hypothetical protein